MPRVSLVVRSTCAAFVFTCAAVASAASNTVYVPENLAVTQRFRAAPVESPQPSIRMQDYEPILKQDQSHPGFDGHLVAKTLAGKKNASGVEVYLLADSPYTEWWARLATINARNYREHVAPPLDKALVEFLFKKTETDVDGNFHFYQVAPGTWLLFAAYELHGGRLTPGDSMQTSYDGDGRKGTVLAPSAKYDASFVQENFSYLYAFTFANETSAGWNVGDVPNNEWLVNGAFK